MTSEKLNPPATVPWPKEYLEEAIKKIEGVSAQVGTHKVSTLQHELLERGLQEYLENIARKAQLKIQRALKGESSHVVDESNKSGTNSKDILLKELKSIQDSSKRVTTEIIGAVGSEAEDKAALEKRASDPQLVLRVGERAALAIQFLNMKAFRQIAVMQAEDREEVKKMYEELRRMQSVDHKQLPEGNNLRKHLSELVWAGDESGRTPGPSHS